MTREEAIKVIEGRFEIMDYCEDPRLEEALNLAIESLKQPRSHWTPCSEHLPEEDVEVFVYLFNQPIPYIAWVDWIDECWRTDEFKIEKDCEPIAWMPLPEPYVREGEEE